MQLRLLSLCLIIVNFLEYIESQQIPRGRRHRRRCKADCETCFHKSFCTKCKGGFYLHSGKCLDTCPDGFENNNHSMECNTIVHCAVSEWSLWGPCTKRGKTCGFKRGNETRTREILHHPSPRGIPCPQTSETRKCIVQKQKCSERVKGKDETKKNKQRKKGDVPKKQRQKKQEKAQRGEGKQREIRA
ncbi:R-spondin-3 isoform X2 [Bufo bufo]|uniref:R-spondin-3 isoform X2 n=1 Tax=Bufo bufo TaxID=8384 RepID=UPI001ABE78A0|nr:R-spondin-3 isoform X2 [Bufo bufo]